MYPPLLSLDYLQLCWLWRCGVDLYLFKPLTLLERLRLLLDGSHSELSIIAVPTLRFAFLSNIKSVPNTRALLKNKKMPKWYTNKKKYFLKTLFFLVINKLTIKFKNNQYTSFHSTCPYNQESFYSNHKMMTS